MYTYVCCWTHMFKHLLFVGYLRSLRITWITLLRRNMFQTRFHGSHVAVMSTLALMELLPLTLAVGVLPQTWAGYIHHEAESVPIRGPDPLQRRCWRWVWGWPGWPWWSRVRLHREKLVFHDGKKNWCVFKMVHSWSKSREDFVTETTAVLDPVTGGGVFMVSFARSCIAMKSSEVRIIFGYLGDVFSHYYPINLSFSGRHPMFHN